MKKKKSIKKANSSTNLSKREQEIHNLNQIMRKYQTKPKWALFYKVNVDMIRWKTEELRLLIKGGQRGMKTNYSDYPGLNPGLQDKKVKNDIIWDNW